MFCWLGISFLVDSIGCAGLGSVGNDESSINCVHFTWSQRDAVLAVKMNCLSTEFAAKKHGEGRMEGEGASLMHHYMQEVRRVYHCDCTWRCTSVKLIKVKGQGSPTKERVASKCSRIKVAIGNRSKTRPR